MRIDCCGNKQGSAEYLHDTTSRPVSVRKDGNDIYLKFTKFNPCPIQKVKYIGPTTEDVDLLWAYGDWEKRTQLEYAMDLNTPFDTEEYHA